MSDASDAKKETTSPEEESWTIGRLLDASFAYFRDKGVESPRLSAELLLSHVLQCPRISLYTMYTDDVDSSHRAALRELVRRRVAGAPVAYLTGVKEFYGRPFRVSPDVLIPRPETELIIEKVLEDHRPKINHSLPSVDADESESTDEQTPVVAMEPPAKEPPARILDLGTGSGILGLTLALEFPQSHVTMVDISEGALAVARQNAELLNIPGRQDRLAFAQGDLFACLESSSSDPSKGLFDLIVSNPPYIADAVVETLDRSVRDFEPHLALAGGAEGMDVIAKILENAGKYLRIGGELFVEIGFDQKELVTLKTRQQTDFEFVAVYDDHGRKPRLLHARRRADQ